MNSATPEQWDAALLGATAEAFDEWMKERRQTHPSPFGYPAKKEREPAAGMRADGIRDLRVRLKEVTAGEGRPESGERVYQMDAVLWLNGAPEYCAKFQTGVNAGKVESMDDLAHQLADFFARSTEVLLGEKSVVESGLPIGYSNEVSK